MKKKVTIVKVLSLLLISIFLIMNGGTAEAKIPKTTKRELGLMKPIFRRKR